MGKRLDLLLITENLGFLEVLKDEVQGEDCVPFLKGMATTSFEGRQEALFILKESR